MDAFLEYCDAHREGTNVPARVTNVASFGVFCELAKDVEGLLPVTDLAGVRRPTKFPEDFPSIGDELNVSIAYINRDERKIRLGKVA